MTTSNIRDVVRIYCIGHAGARGNERADSLDSTAPVTGILRMGTMEIIQEKNDNLVRDDSVVEETARLRQ